MSNRTKQLVDYYNSLPAKRTGAGVLIFDQAGRLLLVKPSYRDTWAWPGGGIDEGEAPAHAAIRECEEEIGIQLPSIRPAFINYIPPRKDGSLDVVHFVFTADVVDAEHFLTTLTLDFREIVAARFAHPSEHATYMEAIRVRALRTYLDHATNGLTLYLEDGRLI